MPHKKRWRPEEPVNEVPQSATGNQREAHGGGQGAYARRVEGDGNDVSKLYQGKNPGHALPEGEGGTGVEDEKEAEPVTNDGVRHARF